jgi:hypothetical protein
MTVEVFMKRELMHCPLRLATAQAYDPVLSDPGSLWVNRSAAEEFSLDEPIDASHGNEAVAGALSDGASPGEHAFRREDIEGICANPLRDEPDPVVVGAVRRLGLVGLVTCAVGTGLLRWWHSLTHRVH